MRILIAEDDLASRKFLFRFLSRYGQCDMVVNGLEALDAVLLSVRENTPYELICLDIMMPKVDGIQILKAVRDLENQYGISEEKRSKVIMTTALTEAKLVQEAFKIGCQAYTAKPIDMVKLEEVLVKLGFKADHTQQKSV